MHRLKIYISIFLSLLRVHSYLLSFFCKKKINDIILINEVAPWVVDDISNTIKNLLKDFFKIKIDLIPFFYSYKIIHYGSIHSISPKRNLLLGKGNKIFINIYHIDENNNEFKTKISFLLENISKITLIIVPNIYLYNWLKENSFPTKKLMMIPIAYDNTLFKKLKKSKKHFRQKYKIPISKYIIGSFQKDGNDWGNGIEPKHIKGPDIFVKVVKKLSERYDICCLLTGPSRGYIISELEKYNIDYVYYQATKTQLCEMYSCLDIYLITSRIEGGPKGLMEAMATGIPVVSSKVGMANDIIQNRKNGMINNVGDIEGLVSSVDNLLQDSYLKENIIINALDNVQEYSWNKIIKKYYNIYKEIGLNS